MYRRVLSLILCIMMCVGMVPVEAFAVEDTGLCEHHAEHVGCSFVAQSAGSECTHEHGEECYVDVTACLHQHADCGYVPAVEGTPCQHVCDGSCGYSAGSAEVPCSCEPGEDGSLVHAEGCGYMPAVAGTPCQHVCDGSCGYSEGTAAQGECDHVCSIESGCVSSQLNCMHVHGECGYAEAVAGSACDFVCAECAAALAEPTETPTPVEPMADTDIASGTVGENAINWSISAEGVLTISGNGSLLVSDGCPWADYAYEIESAVIESESGINMPGGFLSWFDTGKNFPITIASGEFSPEGPLYMYEGTDISVASGASIGINETDVIHLLGGVLHFEGGQGFNVYSSGTMPVAFYPFYYSNGRTQATPDFSAASPDYDFAANGVGVAYIYNVTNAADLRTALAKQHSEMTIEVDAPITADFYVTVPEGATMIILGAEGASLTISPEHSLNVNGYIMGIGESTITVTEDKISYGPNGAIDPSVSIVSTACAHDGEVSVFTGGNWTECNGGYKGDFYQCNLCMVYFADMECTEPVVFTPGTGEHSTELRKANYMNCLGGFTTDYYMCTECYSCFADAEAMIVIAPSEGNGIHELKLCEANYTECSGGFENDYYRCTACRLCFADAEGSTDAMITPGTGEHTLEAREADYTAEKGGYKEEYWFCTVCLIAFSDAEGREYAEYFEPDSAAATLTAVNGNEFVIGSSEGLSFRCSAVISAVKLGSVALGQEDYSLSEDGMTLTLSAEFLNQRTAGSKYTLTVVTENGEEVKASLSVIDSGLAIDESNFPDEAFRNFVKQYDTDSVSGLSESEIAAVIEMDCSDLGINDLSGIEHFTALTKLDCSGNSTMTTLSLNELSKLEELRCGSCSIDYLGIEILENLKILDCSDNELVYLAVYFEAPLSYLDCSNNHIKSLDASMMVEGDDGAYLDASGQTADGYMVWEDGKAVVNMWEHVSRLDYNKVELVSGGVYDSVLGKVFLDQPSKPEDGIKLKYNFNHGSSVSNAVMDVTINVEAGSIVPRAWGGCGEGITWILDATGELHIISNYKSTMSFEGGVAPWASYADEITKVSIRAVRMEICDFGLAVPIEIQEGTVGIECLYYLNTGAELIIGGGAELYIGQDAALCFNGGTLTVDSLGSISVNGDVSFPAVMYPNHYGNGISGATNYSFGDDRVSYVCYVSSAEGLNNALNLGGYNTIEIINSITVDFDVSIIPNTRIWLRDGVNLEISGGHALVNNGSIRGLGDGTNEVRMDLDCYSGEGPVINVTMTDVGEPDAIASGECGDNLTWELSNTGVLTISGTGAMWDYSTTDSSKFAPWMEYESSITSIVLDDDITHIGDCAFVNRYGKINYNIKGELNLPTSLKSIGGMAFCYLYGLSGGLVLPKGLETIGENAFYYTRFSGELVIPDTVRIIENNAFAKCTKLTGVKFSDGLKTIAEQAFGECTFEGGLIIPDSVEFIGDGAFYSCSGISSIKFGSELKTLGTGEHSIGVFKDCTALTELEFTGRAPEIADNAFTGITATVYYPIFDSSYTDDVKQNYGGELTWIEKDAIVASGECGYDVTWELNNAGVLTITGTGNTSMEYAGEVPWLKYADQINKVYISTDGRLEIQPIQLNVPTYISGGTIAVEFAYMLEEGFELIVEKGAELYLGQEGILHFKGGRLTVETGGSISVNGDNTWPAAFYPDSYENGHTSGIKAATSYPFGADRIMYFYIVYTADELRNALAHQGKKTIKLQNSMEASFDINIDAESGLFFENDSSLTIAPGYGLSNAGAILGFGSYHELRVDFNRFVDNGGIIMNVFVVDTRLGSGESGDNTSWSVSPDGELILSSTGKATMEYEDGVAPWSSVAGSISSVSISTDSRFEILPLGVDVPITITSGTVGINFPLYLREGMTLTVKKGAILYLGEMGVLHFMGGKLVVESGAAVSINGDNSWPAAFYPDSYENGHTSGIKAATSYPFGTNRVSYIYVVNTAEELSRALKHSGRMTIEIHSSFNVDYDVKLNSDAAMLILGGACLSISDGFSLNVGGFIFGDGEIKLDLDAISYNGGMIADTVTLTNSTINGQCGDELFWKLNSSGRLTITGSGAMWDFESEQAPWAEYGEQIKTLVIEEGATHIGARAFDFATAITEIRLPVSLESIGADAFSYYEGLSSYIPDLKAYCAINFANPLSSPVCGAEKLYINGKAVTSLSIPSGVAAINANAFYGCKAITSLTIPSTVKNIGEDAFFFCARLKTLSLANGIERIGDGAFTACAQIAAVSIPASVVYIGFNAFGGSIMGSKAALNAINVNASNKNYSSVSGVLFNKDKTQLIKYPEAKTDTSYSIPSTVTDIADGAFCPTWSLEKLGIPESVKTIGAQAFCVLHGIKEIVFAGDAPSFAENAFDRTVVTVVYPRNNVSWNTVVGQNYGGEITWKENFDVLASGECGDDLTWTLYTDGMLSIMGSGDMWAFDYDYAGTAPWTEYKEQISEIYLDDGITSIGDHAFFKLEKIKEVIIPEGVTSIGEMAFYHCHGLTDITIPASLKTVGSEAFSIDALCEPNRIYISDLAAWCAIDFSSDTSNPCAHAWASSTLYLNGQPVTELVIPESVTELKQFVFSGVENIKSVKLHDGIQIIGKMAFSSCTNLESINLPDSITSIGNGAFEDCSELDNVILPDGITAIEGYTFYGCRSLSSIVIPDSVKSIGYWAFDTCDSLESLILPEGLETIANNAFYNCSKLNEIIIPASVSSIGNNAFAVLWEGHNIPAVIGFGHDEDASLTLGSNVFGAYSTTDTVVKVSDINNVNPAIESYDWLGDNRNVSFGDLNYAAVSAGRCGDRLTWVLYSDGQLVISGSGDMYDYSDEGSLPWYEQRDSITGISLPEAMTSVGRYAFNGLANVSEVVLPEVLESIGDYAFCGSGIKLLTVPGKVSHIGTDAFVGSAITELHYDSITAPEGSLSTENENTVYFFPASNSSWLPWFNSDDRFYMNGCVDYGQSLDAFVEGWKEKQSGTVLVKEDAVINGSLTVPAALIIDLSGSLTVNGVVNLSGSIEVNNESTENTAFYADTLQISGSFTQNSGLSSIGQVNIGSTGSLELYGGETDIGTLQYTVDGAVQVSGGSLNVSKLSGSKLIYVDGAYYSSLSEAVSENLWSKVYYYCVDKLPDVQHLAELVRCAKVRLEINSVKYDLAGELELAADTELVIGVGGSLNILNGSSLIKNDGSNSKLIEVYGELNIVGDYDGTQIKVYPGGTVDAPGKTIIEEDKGSYKLVTVSKPKATGLEICLADGSILDAEENVDIAFVDSMNLSVTVEPEDASRRTAWKTSSAAVATVDENGFVSFLKPGTVTITATAKDGSGISDSVKFNVNYKGIAASVKFTAALDEQSSIELEQGGKILYQPSGIGLQPGYSAQLNVFGTGSDEPLDPALFSYSVNNSLVSVDENGVVTANADGTAGSSTITVSFTGDPLGRSAKLTVKTIAAQIMGIEVLANDSHEQVTVYGVDADGEFIENPNPEDPSIVSYALFVDKLEKEEESIEFKLVAYSANSDGTRADSFWRKYDWKSSASNIVNVKEEKDGNAVLTIKKNSHGACVVTATARDISKAQGSIAIYVMDITPRLSSSSVTLDSQKNSPAELTMVEMTLLENFGGGVASVSFYDGEYNNTSGEYEKESENIVVEADSDNEKLIISANKLLKNQTIKGQLLIEVYKNKNKTEQVRVPFNVIIKNSVPSITVKQSGKFNLFDLGSTAEISVAAKNETVESVELVSTDECFEKVNWDAESGILTIGYAAENQGDIPAKPDTKLTLLVTLDGYAHAVEKAFTLSAASTKPSLALEPASGVINTMLEPSAVKLAIYDKGSELYLSNPEWLQVTGPDGNISAKWDADNEKFVLTPNGETAFRSGKISIEVNNPQWLEPVMLSYSLTVNTTKPTVKPEASSLKLNNQYPSMGGEVAYSLSMPNLDLEKLNLSSVKLTSGNAVHAANITLSAENGFITAKLKNNSVAAGSYVYSYSPVYTDKDGNEVALNKFNFTVKVENTLPTAKLEKTSLSLNNRFATQEAQDRIIASGAVPAEGFRYFIAWPESSEDELAFEPKAAKDTAAWNNAMKIKFKPVEGDELSFVAYFDKTDAPDKGSYAFNVYASCGNGTDTARTKAMTLTVKVSDTLPTAKLSQTTVKLNKLFPGQQGLTQIICAAPDYELVSYTIKRMDTTASALNQSENIIFVDADGNEVAFTNNVSKTVYGSELKLRLKDNSVNTGNYKFSVTAAVKYNNSDAVELKALNFTVNVSSTQPKAKLSAASISLNKALSGMEIGSIELSSATAGYEVVSYTVKRTDTSAAVLADAEKISFLDDNEEAVSFNAGISEAVDGSKLRLSLASDEIANRSYKFSISATVKASGTDDSLELSPINFTVKTYSNDKLSVSLKSSGKLDVVQRADSAISYTVNKFTNVLGSAVEAELEPGVLDNDRFSMSDDSYDLNGNKIAVLKLKDGLEYATNVSYKIRIKYTLDSGVILYSDQTIKLSSTSVKYSVFPSYQTVYQSQDRGRTVSYEIQLNGDNSVKISTVKLDESRLSQQLMDALVDLDNVALTVSEDGKSCIAEVGIWDTSVLVSGKSYTIPLIVENIGQAENVAPAKLNLSIKVLQ